MSELTKEWLRKTIAELEEERDATPGEVNEDAVMALAAMKLALASLEAEPVGYVDAEYAELLKSGHIESCSVYAEQGEGCITLFTVPPAPVSVPDYPETLPCPVMLEPGLRFGKGVNTRTMLGALQRRAEFHAELEAMTPEQRAEHDAGMKEFAAMLQGAEPVTTAYKLRDAVEIIRSSGIAIDAEKILAERDALNSPVIPDWQAKAEKLAELHGSSFVVFRNGESPQCADPSKVIISFTDEGFGRDSAAPQQEV